MNKSLITTLISLAIWFLVGCVPNAAAPQVVVVTATPQPTQTVAVAPEGKQYSFVDVLVITPVAVDLPPALPIESPGDYFTPEVQQWADEIRRWSQQYGVPERMIAILMQATSCGDPNYDNGFDRFGLFGAWYVWFEPGVNMFDPDANAAAALSALAEYNDSTWGAQVFHAYFETPQNLISSGPHNLSAYSERAQNLFMKSRTGRQVCPEE